MATLKANGGVYRYLDKATPSGAAVRVAVCQNGNTLRRYGDGWKRWLSGKPGQAAAEIVAALEKAGFTIDQSGQAVGMQLRTSSDAIWHRRAIAARRHARQAGLY